MRTEDSATGGPWQFSLRGLLLLTAVIAAAVASWLCLGEFAIFGIPFWIGLIAVALSRRGGWEQVRVFAYGFCCGCLLLLFLICLIAYAPPWNVAF